MIVKMTIPLEGPDRRCTECNALAFYVFFQVIENEISKKKFVEDGYKCLDCCTFEEHARPSLNELNSEE